jgi:tetratricopeptide (TPR) repeat protein
MRTEHNIARVTMQLITVEDQTHLWAENYEHSLDSPMALQRELAQRVASDVGLVLTGKLPALDSLVPAVNGPGAEEYFQGRFFLNQLSAESLRKSVAAFDRAIALEPEFGPAYGGKAEALQLLTNFSLTSPADVMPEAIRAINSAVAFAPNSAEVFASLGHIHTNYSREWVAGERAFQRSLELNPSLAIAHQWYAEALANLGRFDEAMKHGQEAHRLDPLSVAVECSIGHVLWLARRYDELLAAMDRVMSKDSNYPLAYILKFCAHFEQGHYAAAFDTCQTAIEATGEPMPFAMLSVLARGANGEPDQTVECLNNLEQQAKQTFVSRFFFAMLTIPQGDSETTIEHLEKACDEGVWHVTMLGQCAMFDELRRSERFDAILRKIGLYESRYTGETF